MREGGGGGYEKIGIQVSFFKSQFNILNINFHKHFSLLYFDNSLSSAKIYALRNFTTQGARKIKIFLDIPFFFLLVFCFSNFHFDNIVSQE